MEAEALLLIEQGISLLWLPLIRLSTNWLLVTCLPFFDKASLIRLSVIGLLMMHACSQLSDQACSGRGHALCVSGASQRVCGYCAAATHLKQRF